MNITIPGVALAIEETLDGVRPDGDALLECLLGGVAGTRGLLPVDRCPDDNFALDTLCCHQIKMQHCDRAIKTITQLVSLYEGYLSNCTFAVMSSWLFAMPTSGGGASRLLQNCFLVTSSTMFSNFSKATTFRRQLHINYQ